MPQHRIPAVFMRGGGNMSSAMGPFAVDEVLVRTPDPNGEALVRNLRVAVSVR